MMQSIEQMELLPTVVIPDFLSTQELNNIVSTIMNNSHPVEHRGYDVDSTSNGLVSIRHVVNNSHLDLVASPLADQLLKCLGQRPIFKELWILEEYWPLGWHTDCHHVCTDSGQDQFYTIIIPLVDANTMTVIADQIGWVMPNPLEHLEIVDYAATAKLVPADHRIPMDFWKNNLGHCPQYSRSFFTLHKTFEWRRGSLLAFDRRRWHASDNFFNHGIDKKTALVSFTNVATQ